MSEENGHHEAHIIGKTIVDGLEDIKDELRLTRLEIAAILKAYSKAIPIPLVYLMFAIVFASLIGKETIEFIVKKGVL